MEQQINLEQLLQQWFGFDRFRPGQREIITAIVEGRDVLGVLPTGSGKSLCYQLPAVIGQGVTLVISPLVALMHDQVAALLRRGIPATTITSGLGSEEIAFRIRAAQQGQLRLLYIAPERLENATFLDELRRINVERIVVDEAHCISQWGHDFRPAYLRIGNIARIIGRKQLVALTATATPTVREDIIAQLSMHKPIVYVGNFDRPNLEFHVVHCRTDSADYEQKAAHLAGEIERCHGAAIVYAGTRQATETIASLLHAFKINARAYHAGLPDPVRHRIQEWFMTEARPVLVATVAFGMGIDKPDVRLVAHCDIPLSLEQYYQEAGRAGRDGRPARCVLFYTSSDERLQERMIEAQYPSQSLVEKLYTLIADRLRIGVGMSSEATLRYEPSVLARMLSCSVQTLESAIDFLERQHLLERTRGNSTMRVRIITSRERWQQYCLDAPPDRAQAMEALLRSIPLSTYEQDVELSLDQLEQRHAVSFDQLNQALRAAELARVLAVTPISYGEGIRLIGPRYSRERLPIDWSAIEARQRAAWEKAEAMREYIHTQSCKRAMILKYFGQDADENCGACSSCRRTVGMANPSVKPSRSAYEEYIRKVLLHIIAEYDGILSLKDAIEIGLGQPRDRIVALGANNSAWFGKLTGIPGTTLRTYIDQLRTERLLSLERSTGLLHVTSKGWYTLGRTLSQRTTQPQRSIPQEHLETSVLKTVELAQLGYSPAQIAQERNLSLTTVVSHLVKALSVGVDLPREQLIDGHIYQQVCHYVRQHPHALLRDVQAYIGGSYDLALLRLVLAFARRDCARR
jgi:ATP-dependent DNA helicase RecQ